MAEPDTTLPAEGDFLGDAVKEEGDPPPGKIGPGARAEPDHKPHPPGETDAGAGA